ncbi:hypothetical protein BGX38DRAFT_1316939 [Terfezia claveryi]|nr:hypothetical protein BGX38DRAFT_1316939 [Terfezia claveryi]
MAPPPRGVVFGPIKDWGKGGCKLLLEHDGEGVEKDLRDEEEAIKVMDGLSAERVVEILKRSIAIQDGTVNSQLEGYDVEYQKSDEDDRILESIMVRPAGADSGAMFGITHHWTLSILRGRKRRGARTARMAKEQLARLETELENISEGEEESDRESSRKQSVGNGKKQRLESGKSLQELGEELGIELVKPAVPRSFEEIKNNVFGVPPSAWDLNIDEWPDKESNQGRGTPPETPLSQGNRLEDGLLEEKVAGLMEDLVEGQGPTNKEDTDMEEEMEGTSGQGRTWKAVFKLRSELELVGAIRENAEVLR